MRSENVLLVGCGYCGCALARLLVKEGAKVWGTTRGGRKEEIEATGATPLLWNAGSPMGSIPEAWRGKRLDVVFLAPPVEPVDDNKNGFRSWMEALASQVQVGIWVYVGSTSVYGDGDGEVVHANSPRKPVTERGRKRAAWEDFFREESLRLGWPSARVRLPGIYGPGRNVIKRLRGGQYALVNGGVKWSSRIHRDDVAATLLRILHQGGDANTFDYILCDDTPFQVKELIGFLTRRLGLPMPPEVSLEEYAERRGAFAASFWYTSNRYSNASCRTLPGFELAYPSFREGYAAMWEEETGDHGI